MIKAKYKSNEVLKINYFYQLFAKCKLTFPTLYFFYPIQTRKKTIEVDKQLYKNLIQTYFKVYFNEFYHESIPKYFPLSGKLVKTKGKAFYYHKEKKSIQERSIIWTWYERPSLAYNCNVALEKQKGNTSNLYALEKQYKLDKDVELLPTLREVSTKIKTNNKLFKA